MKKSIVAVNTITNKCIRMINQSGATWEDLAEMFGLSIKTLQKYVKESYSRKGNYKNLLKKAGRKQIRGGRSVRHLERNL
jgi:predicted HTH transcriptional regulator